jgi:hypothetical protein
VTATATICEPLDHAFVPMKGATGYFKETGRRGFANLPVMDQTVSYAMLYCTKCGTTKEVVQCDYRKEKP